MSGLGDVWLVLPTYDEADNLEAIVAGAREHLPEGSRILVVDDGSPDGTGEIADRLAAASGDVEVLHRSAKQGIGPAYVAGFRHVLERGARLVAQMDADFSHDPAHLPRLIAAVKHADVAIGSRYAPGGRVTDWGPIRRSISRGGGSYARTVLGVGIRDLTGGFKVFRSEVLEAIDPGTVAARGYAFQIETTYRAIRAGYRVVEVPIVFRDRRVGQSKMSAAIVAEAALAVPRMRLGRR